MEQVAYAREKRNQFLNVHQQGLAEYCQANAKLIDEEVKAIINQQYQKAESIINQLQDILGKGANRLL